ncbi:hypothetical protein DYB37_010232 [Aphanomyces astaci]|uniref:Glycosyltransferase 2-like domain-containing protein n=1 Tax=Aphanomyces astaci TaxID=112090 RepID=A0A3R6X4W8_APHAT|nr:hypothetical protein DYB35_009774 [Aphanomyces astaci]RHZ06627.1 hypothetical protein DYB37_010232 [Aphanomyces astaci]
MLLLSLLALTGATQIAIINHHDDLPVSVSPFEQHIPLDGGSDRPPPPRVPTTSTVFVGLSSFRDGSRCGYTIFTGLQRATYPSRVHFGVVDQLDDGDESCLDAYCKLARDAWPDHRDCRYKKQITVDTRQASTSRGPSVARHYQQALVGDQDFCLQLDAHSIFTRDWDSRLVQEWGRANNEMAVLTTYLHAYSPSYVDEMGTNIDPGQYPHLCTTVRGGNKCVRNEGASMLLGAEQPQLSALWGAGLSFSKCHAETRVRIDPHTLWMFDGEEFLRASHLWTHTVGLSVFGPVDEEDLNLYQYGPVRSFEQYLAFAGIDLATDTPDRGSCKQLRWQPYQDATVIEELLPGWTMRQGPMPSTSNEVALDSAAGNSAQHYNDDDASPDGNGLLLPDDVMAVGVRQGKVLSGSLLRVQHSNTKGGVPYQVHVMIAMAAILVGLGAFVVKANRRAMRRQLKKFVLK